MAVFYLARHGSNDYLGKALAGRLPGVSLNEEGRLQAERLGEKLGEAGIQRIITSPLERARETAEPLARRLNIEPEVIEDFLEVGFGDWNGATMADLGKSEHWAFYNSYRSGTRPPNGELILEIQARFVRKLEELRCAHPETTFAIFSHGDPIRSALCYYLGMPLDFINRVEVSPGSYSILKLEKWGPQILTINSVP